MGIRKFKPASLILLTCISISAASFAQGGGSDTIPHPPLEQLAGYSQTIYYSPGYETRAESIAGFMEKAGAFFKKEIKYMPKATLYILGPQHWKSIAAAAVQDVYGFPHNIDDSRLVIAAADNDFWRSFLPPADQLPPPVAADVKKAYGQPDGSYSMMPFFDLLALHEMGHSYHSQAGLHMQRNWMKELFVNIMLHTYIAEKQRSLLPALETFPNMVTGAGTAEYTFTSLRDFERLYASLGMGARNYGWYQCKLHAAAKDVYNAGGKKVLKKLWKALKKHQEKMTDEAFAQMLSKEVHASVADVFLKWNKTE
ncbi:MAG TPA: hypothetical protein PKC69_13770 [Chitinophagaceae bacterium]|nr:hypothetical protein [Chitinophagaceae bacterium]